MDNLSEFLLGPQQSTSSGFGVVVTVIAVALASTLMVYLLRCYVQEGRIRRRIRQRSHQPYSGNIVPAVDPLAEIQPPVRTASIALPPPHRDERSVKVRRRARGPHPWKQAQFHVESPTPH